MSKPYLFQMGALALVAGAVSLIYCRALDAPFVFDDAISVAKNASIRQFWPLVGDGERAGPLNPPKEITTSGRPLVNLSLAVNYHFGRLNPIGYRVFNLILHVLSAWLLMGIVCRTLRLDYFEGKFNQASGSLALIAALLWAVHPLQTETVVYVTQRTELMVGFFYFGTLYASLRYWASPSFAARNIWLAIASLACAAGMASKEVMVSAPVVVLLFERTFISPGAPGFRTALRRSWPLYLGLCLGWGLLCYLNCNAPRWESAGFHFGVPAYAWWFTQAKVLWMYLKLTVWPWPLAIHYEMPYLTTLGEAWPWLLPVALLGVVTLVSLWRRSAIGFVGAWVLLILLPTLVVPLPTEVAAERRMYLPLAAILTLLVVAGYSIAQRWPAVLAVALAGALAVVWSGVSIKRLAAYHDEVALWQDTVAHQSGDYLAYNNFGKALSEAGRFQEAIPQYEESLRLNPKYYPAHNNLATALSALGQSQQAVAHIAEALRLNPKYDLAYINLGNVLHAGGQLPEAIKAFRQALLLNPDSPEAHNNLGSALEASGDLAEATAHYQAALKADPNFAEAYNNLGVALEKSGDPQAAVSQYQQALLLRPDFPEAHRNLAHALLTSGQIREAVEQYQQALRLMPDSPTAHNDLGLALLNAAKPKEAMEEFQQALRLKPKYAVALANLALALDQLQRSAEALAAAQTALELARSQQETALVREVEDWLNKYRASHPDLSPTNPVD